MIVTETYYKDIQHYIEFSSIYEMGRREVMGKQLDP